jgi:benzoate-CoA ligase family protein
MAEPGFAPPVFPERFNLAEYFLDARVAEGRGDRVAIVHGDRQWTYRQVQAESNRLANVLRARGVEIEDRVLIALPDCPHFAAAFFATLKLGAVVTMVNPELPPEDYEYYLAYTRARALICDRALLPRLPPAARRPRTLRALLARGEGLEEEMAAAPADFVNEDTSCDDLAIWLFTSGSTGKPKGAVHMHHDFAFNTECYAKRVLGFDEDDVTIAVPKLFFGYATGTNLMFPFAVGARTVLFEEKSTPETLYELIARHRPTVCASVPTMINKMLALPGAAARDVSSLRVTISAGEALPEELYRRWKQTFGSEILDGIGSAEMFHIYISNRPGEVRPGTLGRMVPGYEARILDDDGRDVPDGQIGTLWVKGDSAALWYFGAHEKSKEVLRGDWVVSGDKFSRDAEGYFRYAGRGDDLLKVGGIFVAPVEVEGVILEHPGVLECVVVGYEDEDRLVKAKAVVVARAGHERGPALAEAIVAHARARLAHYKVPRRVEFVDELPRSDRGKVLRREVK